jgi:hypothetical protein
MNALDLLVMCDIGPGNECLSPLVRYRVTLQRSRENIAWWCGYYHRRTSARFPWEA